MTLTKQRHLKALRIIANRRDKRIERLERLVERLMNIRSK
jgi:hypothetical protein